MYKASIFATALAVVISFSVFNCIRYQVIVNAHNNDRALEMATVDELVALPSIGESKAIKIKENADKIESLNDLCKIKGIGETNVKVLVDAGYVCR